MTNFSQQTRIQNALVNAAKNGRFYAVSYDKDTSLKSDVNPTTDTLVPPDSRVANEISGTFIPDRNHGREIKHRRNDWKFELRLGFAAEVCTEFFEQDLLDAPVTLPRESGLDPVVMMLESKSVEHPPQQAPSSGTSVVYVFTPALLGRH